MQPDQRRKASVELDFFTEYGEGSRYRIEEVIGKGSYGVVCSAFDTYVGEKVAIKKINDIFDHVSDATRILREIKLLRLLRHPDIVEIKHILLPPSRREFKDIYVVFELMESDLHQVIKANDDLTPEHYQFFLYQLLRGLKYIHTANVFHRDLKPKNILANADCKLKICDFGLARVAFNDTPTAIFWTDYVATRWYRAPELCGSFFSKYTPAIDIWSIGCIFAELLTGKPLFPGKNVVQQLDLMTDLLGTPSAEAIARVRNEKARRYLSSMHRKRPIPFSQKFPNADPLALRLLERMLAFEPRDRPTAEEALADPYFRNLAKVEREPSAQPVTKMEFEFERRRITKEDVREIIYREILEYHPKMLKEFLDGTDSTGFMYPSAVDHFKKQFAYLEENYGNDAAGAPPERQHASLPRPCVFHSESTSQNPVNVAEVLSKCSIKESEKPQPDRNYGIPIARVPLQVPQRVQGKNPLANMSQWILPIIPGYLHMLRVLILDGLMLILLHKRVRIYIWRTLRRATRNKEVSKDGSCDSMMHRYNKDIARTRHGYDRNTDFTQVLPLGLERLLVLCCVTTTAQQHQLRHMNSEERSETLPSQLNMRFLAVHIREETRIAGVIELTMRGLMGPILYSLSLSIFQGKWLQLKMELFIGTDSVSDLWSPTS